MKVLLMRPPSGLKNVIPLGSLYIAGYLRSYLPEVRTEIVDLRQKSLSNKEISDVVRKIAPDIVGISALSMEAKLTHLLARCIRDANKNIKIIVGGPYATSLPHFVLKDNNILCCVIGEGERTIHELLIRIAEHKEGSGYIDLSDVKGIAWLKSGLFVQNPPREFISEMDSIPKPAYDFINMQDYFKRFGTHMGMQVHKEYFPIFTSRGCPYSCVYCHDIFGKTIRYHSAQRVIEEIQLLYDRYNIREIHIEDDSFNLDKRRVKTILEAIINKAIDIKIAFPNGIRADCVDDEMLSLFKKAGVYRLAYGIETGSKKVQKQIRKNLNLDVVNNTVELTVKKGIFTHGFFMFGFLDETKDEMLETVNYALQSKLHTASFSFVIPQVGTQLWHDAVKAGYNFDTIDTDQLNPGDTEINISSTSTKELHKMRRKAYRKFYLNINRLFRLYAITPKKILLFKSFLVFLTNALPFSIKQRERLQAALYR